MCLVFILFRKTIGILIIYYALLIIDSFVCDLLLFSLVYIYIHVISLVVFVLMLNLDNNELNEDTVFQVRYIRSQVI